MQSLPPRLRAVLVAHTPRRTCRATNGWSNQYVKQATALLPAFNLAQPSDWMSLAWVTPQSLDTLVAYVRIAAGRTLPAALQVEYWDGRAFVPAREVSVTWATASEQPTTVRFAKLATTQIRLVITSAAPGTPNGFVQISELQALGDRPLSSPLVELQSAAGGARSDADAATESGGCAAAGGTSISFALGLLAALRTLRRRRT